MSKIQERIGVSVTSKFSGYNTKHNFEDPQDTKLVTELNKKLHSRDNSAHQTIVASFVDE